MRVLGTSPSSVKRRRANYRVAGIDPRTVPQEYVAAPDAVRSKMIALGEVPLTVGFADTGRGVRLTARRVAFEQARGYEALPTSHLLGLARLPSTSDLELTALVEAADRRSDGAKVLAVACAHPACSDVLLDRLVGSSRRSVALAASLERARRGMADWSALPELSEAQRMVLAEEGPTEAASRLVADPSDRVRRVLATRSLRHAASMVLATDVDVEVRMVLGRHSTDGRVLEWLRSDLDPRVRALVCYSGALLLNV